MSSPYAFPVGPTRRAESRTSIPPPEPRSRTVSPGLSIASAVGFPHPSDAFRASSGIWAACDSSYSCEVIGSTDVPQQAVAPQQEFPSLRTRSAASPYFSFTTSRIFVLMVPPLFAAKNFVRLDGLIARAAFRIQKAEKLLQALCVSGIPKKRSFTPDTN